MEEEIKNNDCPNYKKGWEDAEKYLSKKFEKILSKNANQSYDKGFREGADQKDNKPCVCGFWGANKIVNDWHKECEEGK